MTDQKPKTPAGRVAAHRERKRQQGIRSFEISLPGETAEKLKAMAMSEATTLSEIVKRLIDDAPDPT